MRPACKRLGRWFVILAMLSAFGGHWVLLQSVAWTSMVIDNVKHSRLGEALERTFDGRHPCALCKTIEKGRQSEKKQDVQAAIGKITFFCQTGGIVLAFPREHQWQRASDVFARNFSPPPLLQPPRGLLG